MAVRFSAPFSNIKLIDVSSVVGTLNSWVGGENDISLSEYREEVSREGCLTRDRAKIILEGPDAEGILGRMIGMDGEGKVVGKIRARSTYRGGMEDDDELEERVVVYVKGIPLGEGERILPHSKIVISAVQGGEWGPVVTHVNVRSRPAWLPTWMPSLGIRVDRPDLKKYLPSRYAA